MMVRLVMAFAALAVLAACGADGEPVTPVAAATISTGPGGTYVSGGVGVSTGPVSIWVGF